MENQNENSLTSAVAALLGVGANLSGIKQCGIGDAQGKPFLVVPNNYTAVDVESFLPIPTRKRGLVVISHPDSFAEYLNKHKIEGKTMIYAEVDADAGIFKLNGVINDHATNSADWADHTCLLTPKQSIEWTRWKKMNRSQFAQSDFATWIEDNLADIATISGMPTGQNMLEMALNLEINSTRDLRSKVRLQSGCESLEFSDKENPETRQTMELFSRFTIGIPIFDGSASAYPIEARLKYRVEEKRVRFWYELIRPDRAFKTAVAEEVGNIGERTGVPFIYGRKES